MGKKFQKIVENFICLKCGSHVVGNGYTNHCPNCLWSQHIDIYPGDRQETCKGLMEPIEVNIIKGEYIITHKCILCGFTKKNKIAINDNFEEVLKIAISYAKKFSTNFDPTKKKAS